MEMVGHDRVRENDHPTERLLPAQKLNRPRIPFVIKKERTMRQPANEMVAPAILYQPSVSHAA